MPMTADTAALRALLDRVRAAKGPDRDLDADICAALTGSEVGLTQTPYTMEVDFVLLRPSAQHLGRVAREPCPRVTASVDAALALAERVLPGVYGTTSYGSLAEPPHHATVHWNGITYWAKGHTPALALLAALLTCLVEKVKKHG